MTVIPGAAGVTGLVVMGASSQTADLQVWQSPTVAALARVDKDGKFYGDGTNLTGITATDTTKVAKAGDTMTGLLALPADGLNVGSGQLAATGGFVGIGTTSPAYELDIRNTSGDTVMRIKPDAGASGDSLLKIDSGLSSTRYSMIEFQDQGSSKWQMYKDTTNRFVLYSNTNSAERLTVLENGKVGIGVASPSTALAVTGTVTSTNMNLGATGTTGALSVVGTIVSQVHNAGAATTIDWRNSNVQYVSTAPGAVAFENMADGGSYTLVCTSATAGTFTFSQSGLTFKFKPANAATTVYTFIRAGANVYVSWISGF